MRSIQFLQVLAEVLICDSFHVEDLSVTNLIFFVFADMHAYDIYLCFCQTPFFFFLLLDES